MMNETPVYTRAECLIDVPMHFCPGCGHGMLHRIMAELIDELAVADRTVIVAPVGCGVLTYDYLSVDTVEAAHGRVPAVATGAKRARPDLFVIGYQGDGDLASIGTAEIIHAANRGENYTTVFVNNTIYGMTGGQMAPTTLAGQKSTTCRNGRDTSTMGHPVRMCEIMDTMQSPAFIARTMLDGPAGIRKTKKTIKKAFECQLAGKGFGFVEVLSPCPTHMKMTARQAMEHVKTDIAGYFPTGTFRDVGGDE